jgi:hypothetical protein
MTIDLPDDLLRRIKVQAALTDRKLKALVPELLESGLRQQASGSAAKAPPRVPLAPSTKKTPMRRRA